MDKRSRNSFHGHTNGGKKSSEYRTWQDMFKRCRNPRHPSYANYGGRGITVCDRWRTFTNFLADMGTKPSPNHSIDRIDNDGNYEPTNCRWATRTAQNLNKRYKPGMCGFVGVARWGKRFLARIRLNGTRVKIGVFDTPEKASVAYEKFKARAAERENSTKPILDDVHEPITPDEIRDSLLSRARDLGRAGRDREIVFSALQMACSELSRLRSDLETSRGISRDMIEAAGKAGAR